MPIQPKQQPPYYEIPTPGTGTYKAKLTQTGTAAPTQTIIQNTTSLTLPWIRDSLGIYQQTLPNTTPDKIWINGYSDFSGNSTPVTPLTNGSALAGYYTIYWFADGANTIVEIDVYDTSFTEAEWSDIIGITPIPYQLQILP